MLGVMIRGDEQGDAVQRELTHGVNCCPSHLPKSPQPHRKHDGPILLNKTHNGNILFSKSGMEPERPQTIKNVSPTGCSLQQ